MKDNTIELKWGTLKAWKINPETETGQKLQKLLEEYSNVGASMSAMLQHDTQRQKEIICEMIDLSEDPEGIYLHWDGKCVPKEAAKKYVLNYGKDE